MSDDKKPSEHVLEVTSDGGVASIRFFDEDQAFREKLEADAKALREQQDAEREERRRNPPPPPEPEPRDEREEAFLRDLTELTRKHGIAISGCGCCGSPRLVKLDRPNDPEYARYREVGRYDELPHDRGEFRSLGDGEVQLWVPREAEPQGHWDVLAEAQETLGKTGAEVLNDVLKKERGE